MTQGKVIAVKPLGLVNTSGTIEPDSTEATVDGIDNLNSINKPGNLIFIEVYEESSKPGIDRKVKDVVCYEDINEEFGDEKDVEFEITEDTMSINKAKNIKIILP